MCRSRQVEHLADYGHSGHEKAHAFCPTCGTLVYLALAAVPDLITIPAASLNDPSQFTPQVFAYAIRGHAWDTLCPALQKFEWMPAG